PRIAGIQTTFQRRDRSRGSDFSQRADGFFADVVITVGDALHDLVYRGHALRPSLRKLPQGNVPNGSGRRSQSFLKLFRRKLLKINSIAENRVAGFVQKTQASPERLRQVSTQIAGPFRFLLAAREGKQRKRIGEHAPRQKAFLLKSPLAELANPPMRLLDG